MRIPSLLLAGVFASLASAQTTAAPDPYRHVPPDAALVVRTKGFAGWGTEFAQTGIGKMVAGGALAKEWRELLPAIEEEMEIEADDRARWTAVATALEGHTGDIVLGVSCSFPGPPDDVPPVVFATLAMVGDGNTDLDVLGKAIAALLPGEGQDRELAGEQVKVHTLSFGAITAPFVRDGVLLLLFGTDLEQQARECFEPREKHFVASDELQRGAFALQCEVRQVVDGLCAALAESTDETVARAPEIVRMLGGLSVQKASFSFHADGAYVAQCGTLEWNDAPRGFFDVLMPVRANPRLREYLPADATSWSIDVVDFPAMLTLAKDFLALDLVPFSRERIEEQFTAFTKLRLEEDVMALLGGEQLRIDDLAAIVTSEDEVDEGLEEFDEKWGNACYVLQLRDGKTLAANCEKAVRARGLHVGRKTEAYGDVKIHRLNLLGSMPLEYAFAGDLLVYGIGGGEGTVRNLRKVLDMVAARAKGEAPAEFAVAIQQRLQGLPADWATIETASLVDVIDGMIGSWDTAMGVFAAEELEADDADIWHHVNEFVRQLRPELVRHGADQSVGVGYLRKDRFTYQWRW
jgi:hypothetical protein